MENTFFLPVGREITVDTQSGVSYNGELLGLINMGGIPAVWIKSNAPATNLYFEAIVPLHNICGLTVYKPNTDKGGLIGL